MKWSRVIFPVVLEKFELLFFFANFFFSLSLSIEKRSSLAKIWGLQPLHPLPRPIPRTKLNPRDN